MEYRAKKCVYCKVFITSDDIRQKKAHKLLGTLSHKICDEVQSEKIDNKLKIKKGIDAGEI